MFGVSGGGRTIGILVGLEEEDEVITVAFALIVVQAALAELSLEIPLFIDGAEPGARAGP